MLEYRRTYKLCEVVTLRLSPPADNTPEPAAGLRLQSTVDVGRYAPRYRCREVGPEPTPKTFGRPAFGYSLGCVVPRRNDCPVPIGCPFRAGPHRARGPWLSARRIVAASLLGGLLGHSGQSCTRVLMLHFPRPRVSAIEPTRLRAAFITYSLCPRVT